MEELTPFKMSSAPGTPLQQISPERINQMRIPQSPSVPAHLGGNERHQRRDSIDVKAKVAFLNGLAGPLNSPVKSPVRAQLPASSNAAIQRAILGREEAEAALAATTAQLDQARTRERMVCERVESLMEQLQDARSRQRHERQVYEKEIKTCKKSEYKAELAVIKLQEELKEIKHETEGLKARAEHDKAEKEKARQEAFERAYALAGLTEETELLKEKLKIVEQERDSALALAANAAPIVHEAEIALGRADLQEAAISRKEKGRARSLERPAVQAHQVSSNAHNVETSRNDTNTKLSALQEELMWVRSQLKREQNLVHFMNMQCQFKACPCRQAEKEGVRFVHDIEYDLMNAKKRKADNELPLPEWISLKQRFRERDGVPAIDGRVDLQHSSRQESPLVLEAPPFAEEMHVDHDDHVTLEAVQRVALQPNPEDVSEIIPLDEAADIPLPSPRTDSLEPTAVLEEFTQVMIQPQPTRGTDLFSFCTSVSSRNHVELEPPTLRESKSAINVTDELFDLAPRRHIPARPSTSMGTLTLQSPIRVVPESPATMKKPTPLSSPHAKTIQVPLKDANSPSKSHVVHRRSQSRPNIHQRSQSRGRSPGPGLDVSTSDSPASVTFFPITPIMKHSQTTHQRAHTVHHTQTTTTTVPLRDLGGDDVFDPVRVDRSLTQPDLGRHLQEYDSAAVPNMIPGTPITREAALAQIRARRDRARSVNMKKAAEEEAGRKTPKSAARRGLILERTRDVSQASAPGRF